MANYCWNSVEITEFKKEDFSKIVDFFRQDSCETFTYFTDWCESILSDENKIDTSKMKDLDRYYAYGTKWWSIDYDRLEEESTEDYISVSGESAWSPPLVFLEALSKEFKCNIEIKFEESGCDFGGHNIYKSGDLEEVFKGTYREYQVYEFGALEAIEKDIETIDDVEYAIDVEKEYLDMDMFPIDVENEIKQIVKEKFKFLKESL